MGVPFTYKSDGVVPTDALNQGAISDGSDLGGSLCVKLGKILAILTIMYGGELSYISGFLPS